MGICNALQAEGRQYNWGPGLAAHTTTEGASSQGMQQHVLLEMQTPLEVNSKWTPHMLALLLGKPFSLMVDPGNRVQWIT